MAELAFGLSPCPNDTFAFHAWIAGLVDGAPSVAPWFADIEALNRRARSADPLSVTKLSAALLPEVADCYRVSTAGAALGRGCGPLVLVREDSGVRSLAELAGLRVAMPGEMTTAVRLFRSFGPAVRFVEVRFDEIEAMVAAGECDAGLVIHESRFTFEQHGLRAVADLGDVWERDTGMPLPLGVIAIRRDEPAAPRITAAIRRSVEIARGAPELSRSFVREHAQEMDEDVCAQHIALYVNDFSVELGDDGRRAVERLVGQAIDWVA